MKGLIAIVDDDIYISDMEARILIREGYQVVRAYSGTEALLLFQKTRPDLIILDLMLPGLNGEEVLAQIQGIPVIVVSAKVDVQDKVRVLLGGAADYLSKPFEVQELLARIEVQLRKRINPAAGNTLKAGLLELNPETRETWYDGSKVPLTRTEYAILKFLMIHAGQVVSKGSILDSIGEDTLDGSEQSLKVHMSNLRSKLKKAGAPEDLIEAVWGIGFILTKA